MVKINKQEVQKLMEKLGISEEEAIELIKFDNDEIDNDEVTELEQKAKKVKESKKRSPLEKVKNAKAKKKTDENKEKIMALLEDLVKGNELFTNPKNVTPTKITFTVNGEFFTISLTKHKKCPDGYSNEG